ncbi:hypothetical+protein [Methylocapsa aurea]|uniref:hypothetical protein n=1 Tax=Methylocapsa aurea TaxID=663610 RepID=UPI003D18BE4D
MTEKVRHVSLAEQIRVVDRARLIVSGAAKPSALARERDYEVEGIEAALRTLRWNHAHEAEIREDWARRRGDAATRRRGDAATRTAAAIARGPPPMAAQPLAIKSAGWPICRSERRRRCAARARPFADF